MPPALRERQKQCGDSRQTTLEPTNESALEILFTLNQDRRRSRNSSLNRPLLSPVVLVTSRPSGN